jgi:ATP-dependent DNA helicase RecQ
MVKPDRLPPDAFALVTREGGRQQSILQSRIEAAREYAETVRCRRADLLGYFGEHYEPPCGTCDNDEAAAKVKAQPSKANVGRRHEPDHDAVRVRHKLWGEGTLLTRDDHELTVAFDTLGYRHLTPAVLENGILTMI